MITAIVFCGVQGSGKSTFFASRFAGTHVRLNRDMLGTRHREDVLLHACLAVRQPFVADLDEDLLPSRRVFQNSLPVQRRSFSPFRGRSQNAVSGRGWTVVLRPATVTGPKRRSANARETGYSGGSS